ncbi:transcriptional regulator [Neisseria sp. ZJ106]|uniref:Transcriptional regulator n=1 Tax=Neisseria lisongii TaxID=2912188 RepID=A0ABY7RH13_9NEIS|nr:protein YgfX [Neisseria lisongii]MCF7521743.1 transcriptional regulator [Neisseria lisongii]WCL70817.1 transcriptional regulator [Neisseria lisongii]
MRPFQTALRPSKTWQGLIIGLHVAACAVCIGCFYGIMMWAGLAALAVSFARAWRTAALKRADSVRKIEIDSKMRAGIWINGKPFAAELLDSSVVGRRFLFLHWRTEERTIRQLVAADMLDQESCRRLKVWARWCRQAV